MRALLVLCLVLMLSGCFWRKARPEAAPDPRIGEVGVGLVAVPAESRMQLPENERFEYPLPDPSNVFPNYPEALLAQRLPPQAVCVSISISAEGHVFRVDPMQTGEDCEETARAPIEFRQAVYDAVGFWRFDPAFRCVYPEGVQPGQLGCIPPGREVPVAVSLPYRFVFLQVEGKGVVTSQP
jgi:hypothetical protein